jgi:hypothetical protein
MERFVAPKNIFIQKRMVELEFSGLVTTGAFLTIVAGPIMYPFRIVEVSMTFDQLANYLIEYRWFISGNNSAPTTAFPSDTNIFGQETPTTHFIGSGMFKRKYCSIEVKEPKRYIKFSIFNGNTYDCYGLGSMQITEI